MASKSRKRRRKRRRPTADPADAGSPATAAPRPAPPHRRRRAPDDEPPPAPWGSFPLIELTVLVGIIMLVAGFLFIDGQRGTLLVGTGLALASIGGLEVSIREHFAGYRSHTLILAGVPAAMVLAALFFLGPDGLPPLARAAIAVAVFAAAAALLVRIFRNRSGGQSFRLATFRRR